MGARDWLKIDGVLPPDGHRSDDGEKGKGQYGEGDVPVSGGPGADLVLVQANLTFKGFEGGFDGSSCSGNIHQCAAGVTSGANVK